MLCLETRERESKQASKQGKGCRYVIINKGKGSGSGRGRPEGEGWKLDCMEWNGPGQYVQYLVVHVVIDMSYCNSHIDSSWGLPVAPCCLVLLLGNSTKQRRDSMEHGAWNLAPTSPGWVANIDMNYDTR
jgi:hypothetical protein